MNDQGILRDRCETSGCRGGDAPQFKGIFIRNLACLNDSARKPEYSDFLVRNAHSVWLNDRDTTNHLGLRWAGPFDRADAARHSSAMAALGAVAEPMTAPLVSTPAVGGRLNWAAANLTHDIGRRSGSSAWSADPVHDRASGFLVTGPHTRDLRSGLCSATFELKVDNFNLDNSVVATISVVESDSGKTVASEDLTRN